MVEFFDDMISGLDVMKRGPLEKSFLTGLVLLIY